MASIASARATLVASSLSEAAPFPSFARYMQGCLYEPGFGFYSSGRVVFGAGDGKHFWTYPQRMSPVFGWMLAETVLRCYDKFQEKGLVFEGQPFTVLELGAGNGDLARDTLTYVAQRLAEGSARWQRLAPRFRYVIGEHSAQLRRRQSAALAEHIKTGRADVRDIDARELTWEGPFQGIVFANELLDAFPCERLRIYSSGDIRRVHVVALADGSVGPLAEKVQVPQAWRSVFPANSLPLSNDALWDLLGGHQVSPAKLHFREVEVPLSLGWNCSDSTEDEPPSTLPPYLDSLQLLISDLSACGQLPVDLYWSAGIVDFVDRLAAVLHGPDRCGLALLIDYGGTSRHVLDPRSVGPHLRIYSGVGEHAHTAQPYRAPGYDDITWDIDFTEVSRLARQSGLITRYFGHQRILEFDPIDLHNKRCWSRLVEGRTQEGIADTAAARREADQLIARFRSAQGFRAIVLSSPKAPFPEQGLPESDSLDGYGLWGVRQDYDPVCFAEILEEQLLPRMIADYLKPCGDVVADLCDGYMYEFRTEVLETLERVGALCPPGSL